MRRAATCRAIRLMWAAAMLGASLWAPAQGQAQPAAPVRSAPQDMAALSATLDYAITLRADRTAETIQTIRVKVLAEAALQTVGQQSASYVEGMQTLDIVEAYTEKPDGRRIAVDPASILTRDAASGLNAIYLRDQKQRTVIFPALAVGDTIVLKSRREDKAGMFPGQYFNLLLFPRHLPIAEASARIEAPNGVPLKVAHYGEGFESRIEDGEGTTRHVITFRPQRRLLAENGATSPLDRDPRIVMTTFQDYDELGRSYWQPIAGKVAVTPEIRALAEEITRGIDEKRAQAEAIDRWVKTSIRYVAVYLGNGRYVPNDAATVLENKYGDCKDHATLMTALLAAKDIAAEQALINSGNVYTLPETVAPGHFNHVILYLPEFDLYTDPTVHLASFGVLSAGAYDKPVLHASEKGTRLARTPAMRAQDHMSVNLTRITVAADGTVSGTTSQRATGIFAIVARSIVTRIQNVGRETAAEKQLGSFGRSGKGRFDFAPLSDLSPLVVVSGQFTFNDRTIVRPGNHLTIPFGMPILVRPTFFLLGERIESRRDPFVCLAGRQIEDIEITFADDQPLPRAPAPRRIETRLVSYISDYRVEGRTLKVRRDFTSKVEGQVCASELEAEIASALKDARNNLVARMVFPRPVAEKKPELRTEPHAPREAKPEPRVEMPRDPAPREVKPEQRAEITPAEPRQPGLPRRPRVEVNPDEPRAPRQPRAELRQEAGAGAGSSFLPTPEREPSRGRGRSVSQ